jgi:8-oxo-dGTP diphosphatase
MTVRVAGVVLHRDRRVLLQHRDDKPDIRWPGAWAIFGGHLEDDEDPESGAIREIEEELGLKLQPPLTLVHHELHPDNRERSFYAAKLEVPLEELTLNEGQGMALFSADELETVTVVPLHKRLILEFLATLE